MDEVPKDWLPPYEAERDSSSLFRPESAKRPASKPSLQPKRQGMQQIMGSRRAGYAPTALLDPAAALLPCLAAWRAKVRH